MITDFIKEEWYEQRRMLFWYFLISLALVLTVTFFSRLDVVMNWIEQSNLSFTDVSRISFAVLFMPYAISWMIVCNKTDKENRKGFYKFLHMLPITIKEIVTAKYISVFLMNGLMAIWLCGLWWIYDVIFPYAASLMVWTGLCMIVFFYAFSVLAIQLGFFFRWGSNSLFTFFLFLLIVAGQFEFTGQITDQTIKWMDRFPLLLWGIAILLMIVIWLLCWRWSMKVYRKY